MIDTHAHLDFPDFDSDREKVISRFFSEGGQAIVNIGVDLERSRKSIEISEKHKNIFAIVGMHPDFFTQQENHETGKDWSDELKEMAENKKVVAIGECGLDYFRTTHNAQKEKQKKGFREQIEIASELNLPVVVHCREAWNDLHEIVSRGEFRAIRFVLHCYSGNREDTEKFLKLPNIYFSFSGNITYPKPLDRSEILAKAIRMIPLDRIMLDSDSPFLAPQQFRGKRNEPTYTRYIAEKIAEIKEISGEKIDQVTDANARKFFGI